MKGYMNCFITTDSMTTGSIKVELFPHCYYYKYHYEIHTLC